MFVWSGYMENMSANVMWCDVQNYVAHYVYLFFISFIWGDLFARKANFMIAQSFTVEILE